MRKLVTFVVLLTIFVGVHAQNTDNIRSKNLPIWPKIETADIPGAPILKQAFLVNGNKQEIRVEGHGLCYPALYDWDKDGKKDLIIGDFNGKPTYSRLKVFINKGSANKPKYSGKYFYARDTKGDTIHVVTG